MIDDSKGTLHTDKIKFGGNILYQDEKITVVPCVLMAEGVQNGALKPFEEFYDPEGLEGALWFEGVPIVREHPSGYVYHLTPKIGKVRNVQFDVDNRRVTAEAVLFNDRLTPEERKKIENGEQLGGSIGFWCNDEPLDAAEIWTDGTEYNVIQRAPFFGDHFALVQDPACPVGICGFNVNSAHNDCKCKKQKDVNNLPDEGKAAADPQTVIEEKPPAGDPKPPEGDAKKNIVVPAPKVNAIDMQTLKVKAKTILEMSDDYAKRNEALALLMEIVTEDGPAPAVQSKTPAKVVEVDSKLKERLDSLEATLNSQKTEIEGLKAEKTAREAAWRMRYAIAPLSILSPHVEIQRAREPFRHLASRTASQRRIKQAVSSSKNTVRFDLFFVGFRWMLLFFQLISSTSIERSSLRLTPVFRRRATIN
jgi:hypothetical protein